MIVSHSQKCVFIHIQRTGGSSIINLLYDQPDSEVIIHSQHGNARSPESNLLSKHPSYFKFSLVRNPWDRIFSWYTLINSNNFGSIKEESIKYEEFLIKDLAFAPGDPYFHYNQLDYLRDKDNDLLIDKIYRYENYQDNIQDLSKQLNFGVSDIQKMNQTFHKDYRTYYTDRSKALIFEKCRDDIDYFGYQF